MKVVLRETRVPYHSALWEIVAFLRRWVPVTIYRVAGIWAPDTGVNWKKLQNIWTRAGSGQSQNYSANYYMCNETLGLKRVQWTGFHEPGGVALKTTNPVGRSRPWATVSTSLPVSLSTEWIPPVSQSLQNNLKNTGNDVIASCKGLSITIKINNR